MKRERYNVRSMNSDYDMFECLPNGSVRWRGNVNGLIAARLQLQELAGRTGNDHFAVNLTSRTFVFRANTGRTEAELAERVFQIAYTEKLRTRRAAMLRGYGYGVVSVIGNEAGKKLLTSMQLAATDIALFMVGHGAPQGGRHAMVKWLKARYRGVRIIALNPPNEEIPSADFNVLQNGPELWLPLLIRTAGASGEDSTATD